MIHPLFKIEKSDPLLEIHFSHEGKNSQRHLYLSYEINDLRTHRLTLEKSAAGSFQRVAIELNPFSPDNGANVLLLSLRVFATITSPAFNFQPPFPDVIVQKSAVLNDPLKAQTVNQASYNFTRGPIFLLSALQKP